MTQPKTPARDWAVLAATVAIYTAAGIPGLLLSYFKQGKSR